MIVKQPRKPVWAVVVEKNRLQYAKDLHSTMQVMRPSWRCELIEAQKLGSGKHAFPESVVIQAVMEPLHPVEDVEDIIKTLKALMM
jgi:hypothetical protein